MNAFLRFFRKDGDVLCASLWQTACVMQILFRLPQETRIWIEQTLCSLAPVSAVLFVVTIEVVHGGRHP